MNKQPDCGYPKAGRNIPVAAPGTKKNRKR